MARWGAYVYAYEPRIHCFELAKEILGLIISAKICKFMTWELGIKMVNLN